MIAYLTLVGALPQPGMTLEAAKASVMAGKPRFKGRGWDRRSPEAVDFVTRLIQVRSQDLTLLDATRTDLSPF